MRAAASVAARAPGEMACVIPESSRQRLEAMKSASTSGVMPDAALPVRRYVKERSPRASTEMK